MRRDSVVRRIDKVMDKRILEVKDLMEMSTGKNIKYQDASKILGSNIGKTTIITPVKKRPSTSITGKLDDLLNI